MPTSLLLITYIIFSYEITDCYINIIKYIISVISNLNLNWKFNM